jgi:integrase
MNTMETGKALTRTDIAAIPIVEVPPSYGDDLVRAAAAANKASRTEAFAVYHAEQTENTRTAQQATLRCFSIYLAVAGVQRTAAALYDDAEAWQGMSHGLLKGFRQWMLQQGYRIGTVNTRLAILRQYGRLAHEADVIADEDLELLLSVKGYSAKAGRNIDADRVRQELPTHKSTKKATPTPVTTSQGLRLKTTTTHPIRRRRTRQDQGLETRDALLMGLFIELALRVSEVVGLNIEHFDLEQGTVMVYRDKTDETQVHRLKKHTRLAVEDYLAATGRRSGPLFLGYRGKRITRYGLYDRVRLLGEQLGIDHLSPHDLRHYWTYDALGNGTPLDRVQSGGNWKSPTMVLKYARRTGIANEGVIITE